MSKLSKRILSTVSVCVIIASMTVSVVFATNSGEHIESFWDNIVDTFIPKEEKRRISKPSISYENTSKESDNLSDEVMQFSVDISEKLKKAPKTQKGIDKLTKNKEFSKHEKAKLNDYLASNDDIITVTSLYDFFYENFFTYNDLDMAINRYNNGEDLEEIFSDYFAIEESFEEKEYPQGQLEEWIINCGIAVDDIAVAEILDYRKVAAFDDIISRLSNGEKMSEICETLNLINTSAKLGTVSISRDEINECIEELNMTEKEAIKKVTTAKKAKIKSEDITKALKNNESKGKYIKKYYEEVFN